MSKMDFVEKNNSMELQMTQIFYFNFKWQIKWKWHIGEVENEFKLKWKAFKYYFGFSDFMVFSLKSN